MRMIDLDTLDIFRAVVSEGGVVRAADKLARVPSNVTTRIRQLETRLGVALFQRRGRGLVLTDAGRTLLVYAERLLKLANEAEDATRETRRAGHLTIGSMESTAASRLPKMLAGFHRRHPGILLTIETAPTAALVRRVRDWQLDAAFVGEPFEPTGLQSRPMFGETLKLVTAAGHRPVATPRDLAARTVIAFASGCSYRKRLERWLAGGRIEADRVLELASYQAILACVASGAGFAIMPESVLATFRRTADIGVHDLPPSIARNTTYLVWNGPPSPQLEAFIADAAADRG